ncbi:MAG: alpha/beta fold hydrolase, partial [Planctomycetes bacterium]|nr:alpha/beta fold hydrolase [Planctomycetota bacterium]
WGDLVFGEHEVGFRLLEATDLSRTYYLSRLSGNESSESGIGRDLRIYLWYPAAPSDAPHLAFKNYAELAADDFGPPCHTIQVGDLTIDPAIPLAKGFTGQDLADLMNRRTAAKQEVDPASGSFPLIVFGQGLYYESPITHAILCEYLASHGYTVVTCPLVGTHSRFVRLNNVDLETQVRDLEFAMAQAASLPFVDSDGPGLIGFDMGGMAAVVLQMRNPGIRALATLDAGILFGHFSELPNSSPNYDAKKLQVPWIHLTQNRFIDANLHLLEDQSLFGTGVYADRYLIGVKNAEHVNFTSYALARMERQVPSYWGPLGSDAEGLYRTICLYLLNFMNGYLKADPEGLAFLERDPKTLGSEGASFVLRHRIAKKAPVSLDDFVQALYKRGADDAAQLVREARAAADGEDPFTENDLNRLGYKCLYFWGMPEQAVTVFRLNAELYPDSDNVFDSLGEALWFQGDRAGAIENYRRSLALNPKNHNARAKLEEMGAPVKEKPEPEKPAAVQTAETPQIEMESGFIEVENGRLYYEARGQGEVVVLVHDGLVHSAVWDPVFDKLSGEYRVIRYDRRGYGKSPHPARPYSNVDDLDCLLNALKVDEACFAGMSAGGGLCVDYCLAHAERVRAIALVGAVVSGGRYTEHFMTRGGHYKEDEQTDPETERNYWVMEDPYEIAPGNDQVRQRVKALMDDNPQNLDWAKHRLLKRLDSPAINRLDEIAVPVLILVGEFDIPDIHAHAGMLETRIASSRRVIISRAGHLVPIEQPEAFLKELRSFFE